MFVNPTTINNLSLPSISKVNLPHGQVSRSQTTRTRFWRQPCFHFSRNGDGRINGFRSGDNVEETGHTQNGFAFFNQSWIFFYVSFDGRKITVITVSDPLRQGWILEWIVICAACWKMPLELLICHYEWNFQSNWWRQTLEFDLGSFWTSSLHRIENDGEGPELTVAKVF